MNSDLRIQHNTTYVDDLLEPSKAKQQISYYHRWGQAIPMWFANYR